MLSRSATQPNVPVRDSLLSEYDKFLTSEILRWLVEVEIFHDLLLVGSNEKVTFTNLTLVLFLL